MKEQVIKFSNTLSRSGGFVSYIIIFLLTAIIIGLLGLFFFSPDTVTKFSQTPSGPEDAQQSGQGADSRTDLTGSANQSIQLSDTEISDKTHKAADNTDKTDSGTTDGSSRNSLGPDASGGSDTVTAQNTCSQLSTHIDSFFTTLDSRDYIKDFQLEAPSEVYFPDLIQKLISNPPIVSGETDDLFTILQNTAHFFRILGKKNIFVLKGILDRERDTFEQTLADFYQLTNNQACLEEHFDIAIGQEELYAYAGFFLNTMGGRLYLFRRDSMSRMVVSYYAIMIIEHANREGRNKYGIEIKDAIDNLIIEIESSRIKLKMRDEYLDQLYDLKVKYQ